jgi:hypothetical protein
LAIYNITTPRKKKENLSRMVVRWYVPHASSFQTFLSMLVIYKNNKDILECFFTTKHRFLRKRDVWGLKHKKKRVGCTSRHCHITVNDDTGGLSRSGALLRVLELLNSGSQWCFRVGVSLTQLLVFICFYCRYMYSWWAV